MAPAFRDLNREKVGEQERITVGPTIKPSIEVDMHSDIWQWPEVKGQMLLISPVVIKNVSFNVVTVFDREVMQKILFGTTKRRYE